MYIRGVGNLELKLPSGYARGYNHEIMAALLICGVRAAFNSMVNSLRAGFDVTLLNDFHFDFEVADDHERDRPYGTVKKWSLTEVAPFEPTSHKDSATVLPFPGAIKDEG